MNEIGPNATPRYEKRSNSEANTTLAVNEAGGVRPLTTKHESLASTYT